MNGFSEGVKRGDSGCLGRLMGFGVLVGLDVPPIRGRKSGGGAEFGHAQRLVPSEQRAILTIAENQGRNKMPEV